MVALMLVSDRDGAPMSLKRHQLHVRITPSEYKFLTRLAETSEETLATLVRRLIRAAIRAHDRVSANGTTEPVPPSLTQRTDGNRSDTRHEHHQRGARD